MSSDLHVDLQLRIENIPIVGQCLRHPLVFMVPYHEDFANEVNLIFQRKKDQLRDADANGDFHSAVFLHERPYRLQAFMQRMHLMPHNTYWKLLGEIWTDCEAPHTNLREWRRLFLQNRPGRDENLMTKKERETMDGLMHQVIAFRGTNDGYTEGISWTTDEQKAIWFAQRLDRAEPTVISMIIPKSEIIAYLDHRGEKELIIPNARKHKQLWRYTACQKDHPSQ